MNLLYYHLEQFHPESAELSTTVEILSGNVLPSALRLAISFRCFAGVKVLHLLKDMSYGELSTPIFNYLVLMAS